MQIASQTSRLNLVQVLIVPASGLMLRLLIQKNGNVAIKGLSMMTSRRNYRLLLLRLLLGLSFPVVSSAIQPIEVIKNGHGILQLGGYWSSQGKQQHINIQSLIGDEFTVNRGNGGNGLVGLGYYVAGQEKNAFHMSYGVNAFYLPKIAVSGNVIQENLFTNLAYSYNVAHYPVYAMAKATIPSHSPTHSWTIDAGIGPNFMNVSGFNEQSLDGITLPDQIFSSHTTTTFSATVGLGIESNNLFGHAPFGCGYRFYYLGKGSLNTLSSQVTSSLSTGQSYGNAVICSVII